MNSLRKTILSLLWVLFPSFASGAAYEVFDLDLDTNDSASWQGKEGYVYFLQWSEDITHWNYVPAIYAGVGTYTWQYTGTSEFLFCRVLAVYVPSINPNSDDFDDDGITNIDELTYQFNGQSAQLDPLNSDSDGDGFGDGIEEQLGTDPSTQDHATEWTGSAAIVLTPTS